MFETQVTVVGNVATAVKCWKLPSGDTVAKFRIASNERRRAPAAEGEWIQGASLFVQVTCWRRLAENVLASLGVGDPVMVRGRLYTDEYELDGKRRSETMLEAHAVGPDLNRCKATVTRVRRGDVLAGRAAVDVLSGQPPADHDPSPDVGSATDGGRAVAPATGPDAGRADGPSDDQRERLGAPVEAGVGA